MDKIFSFANLIRNHGKCYLVFLGIICMEFLLFNNFHASMGRMGAIKFVYLLLLLLKEVGNVRLGESDLHTYHYQSEEPSSFEMFCFICKWLQRRA